MKINNLISNQIIITGASGFIGSHLIKHLVDKNLNVIGYYRNYSDRFKKLDISANVIKVDSYNQIPNDINSVLIHLAQASSIHNSRVVNNKNSDVDLTKLLIAKKFFFYIYLSSSAIYGNQNKLPLKENGPAWPESSYAKNKLKNEELFDVHKSTLLRVSNIYGNLMNKGSIFEDIISQLPSDSFIKVRDSSPIREFLHIDDLCGAVYSILLNPLSGVFNIGTGSGISINNLAEIIEKYFQNKGIKIVSASNKDSKSSLILNSDKFMKEANWKPKISIHEGIKTLINSLEFE